MNNHTYETPAPHGGTAFIPANRAEDQDYFTADQLTEISDYYKANGYVVVRGLISEALCDQCVQSFAKEVKPYDVLYHLLTDKSYFTSNGIMLRDYNYGIDKYLYNH